MSDEKKAKAMEIFGKFIGFLSPVVLLWPSTGVPVRKLAAEEAASAEVKIVMICRGPEVF